MRLAGVVRRSRRALLLGTALQATVVLVLALPARAQPAPNAQPSGGVVVAGSASISQTSSATTITQSSQRAALNWKSFDVGSQQSVDFHQPNASAVALNRVLGSNPSQIAGRITANGQVILQNQDGITFTRGAQVNTAGFIATAAGITNKNFMAGHMVFDQPAAPNARIVNEGNITVRQAGIAALVAPQVANSGVIEAKLGRVVLAGAQTATLDLYGDGLVSIAVNGEVKQVPVGPDGKSVTALVTNTGTILAPGGHILLTARAAAGVVQNLVMAGGTVSTPTEGTHTGQIVLNGIGGSIVVAGALLARGGRAGETGGQIEVAPSGGVTLASTARVDASGAAGGGVVAIGTDLARARSGNSVTPRLLSQNVTVARGATIAADATGKGNGGRVTVLSAGSTVMDGAIAARGGPQGGDGGFVEVSGQTLGFDGGIDVGAPAGDLGTILFDPGTLDIVAGTNGSGTLDNSFTTALGVILPGTDGTTGADTVSSGALQALTGNLLLQASTLLSVQAPITLTTPGQSLTLQSGGDLEVLPGASISTQGNITLGAASPGIPGHTTTGSITVDADITTTRGTLSMSAGSGGISLGGVALTAPVVDLSVSGSSGAGVIQSASGVIDTGILQSAGGVSGSVDLAGTANAIAQLDGFVVSGGDFSLTDKSGQTLTVAGSVSAAGHHVAIGADNVSFGGSGSLVAASVAIAPVTPGTPLSLGASYDAINAGRIDIGSLDGGTSATAGTIDISNGLSFGSGTTLGLYASGPIVEDPTGGLNVDTLTGRAGAGGVALRGSNTIATLGSFTVTGADFALTDSGGLTVSGPVSAAGVAITADTLDVGGAIGAAGGAVSLVANVGSLALDAGAVVSGATVALSSPTLIGIGSGGTAVVDVGTSGVLSLGTGAGGVTETTTGTIIAGTLTSAGTIGGPVDLAGSNTIAAIGNFLVGGGDFALADSGAGVLAVRGTLFANDVTLGSGGAPGMIDIDSGTVQSGSGGIVLLNAGTGGIVLTGSAFVGGFGSNTVDLATAGGGITEASTAVLAAASLQSSGGVQGAVDLAGTANAIGQINTFVVSGGDFTLIDGPSQALTVNGLVSAAGQRLAIGADSLAFTATGSLAAGTVALAPVSAAGSTVTLGTGGSGLDLTPADFAQINAGRIDIGSLDDGATILAGAISIAAGISLPATGTLGLYASGPVTEATGGTLTLGTLVGAADGVNLGNENTIATLGSLAAGSGTLWLADAGTLTVAGPVSGRSVTLDPTAIVVPGTITATGGPLVLDAGTGGITLQSTSALFAAGEGVDFTVSGGGVTQASGGTIVAGTLFSTGGVSGTVDLAGSNTIASIGGFSVSAGDFILADGGETGALTLASTLVADNVTLGGMPLGGTGGAPGSIVLNGGTIALNSGGTTIALDAGSGGIALDGTALVNAGTAGTLALGAGAGGVTEASSAAILAGTLLGSGPVGGAVALGGANTIATLGSFIVSGADFTLADGGETGILSVTGPVSALDVTIGGGAGNPEALSVPGSIGASGSVLALAAGGGGITVGGTLNSPGTLELGATGGGVTETGTIVAGALASLGTVTGTVGLNGSNTIASLGGFTVSGGDFVLADAGAGTLSLPATLIANNVTIGAGGAPGTIAVDGGTIAAGSGGTVMLDAGTGGIALSGAALVGGPGVSVVDLSTTGGGVTQATSAVLQAANLRSSGGVVGAVSLAGIANQVGEIDGFVVSGGDFTLIEAPAQALTVAGSVSALGHRLAIGADQLSFTPGGVLAAGTVALAPTSPGSLVTLGSSASGLALTAADFTQIDAGRIDIGSLDGGATVIAGAISITAGITVPGTTTLGLYAQGSIDETGAGLLAAGTLVGGTSLGSVSLLGANAFAALGNFVVGGAGNGFALTDADPLVVAGAVSAPAQIYLQDTAAGGLTLAAGGTLAAGTLASLQTDALSLQSGGTITGTVFELAPDTSSSLVTLGGTGGLSLADLSQIGSGVVRIGAVTLPGTGTLTTTAGSIAIAGAFGAGTVSLGLFSLGDVSQTAVLTVGTLFGDAVGAIDLSLDGNDIGALGSLSAGGSLAVADSGNTGALTVLGPVTGAGVALSDANTGTIVLSGLVGMTGGGTLLTVDAGSGGILFTAAGTLSAPVVELGSAGSIDEALGTILATASLLSLGTIAGTADLASVANQIGTLAGFAADGDVILTSTGSLAVSGPVTGADVALNAGTIGVAGRIAATAADGTVTLAASAGTLALGAGALVTGPTVDLTGNIVAIGASSGSPAVVDASTLLALGGSGVSEGTTGTIVAGTLASLGTVAGTVALTGPANSVTTLAGFAATVGFDLADTTSLTVAGAVAGGTTATIADDASLTVTGSVTGHAVSLAGTNLTLAGFVSDGGTGTIRLVASNGTIGETGTLIAGTLSGSSTGATSLTGTNSITTLGSFSAAGFTLDDTAALTVTGAVAGGSLASFDDTAALTVGTTGSVIAGAVSLTGTSLTLDGFVSDGGSGTTGLVADNGTIGEAGTLIAGTLSGSSTGATSLTGTNSITTLGNFAATGGLTLDDGAALTVAGSVTGGSLAVLDDTAAGLTVRTTGSVIATAVSLTGTSLTLDGFVSDGSGAGTTRLVASNGAIDATGTLISGTLSGSSTDATSLTGRNSVTALGNFSATGGLTLDDGVALTVTGSVTGGSLAVLDDTAGMTVAAGGSVIATAISLTGTDLTLDGVVSDGGTGTTSLVANNGTISGTGTLIAGTLSGSSAGATSLTDTDNSIAALGNFSAAGFTLHDGAALTVTGSVIGGSLAALDDTVGMTVGTTGSVIASAVSLTGASLTLNGFVSDGGTGTTSLVASNGTIGETGTLISGTLGGSSRGATSLTGSNSITTLGNFATSGGLILNDSSALTVTGLVTGGSLAALDDAVGLTVGATGAVIANAVGLAAPSLTLAGLVSDGGTGTTSLIASNGTIGETGTLIAGTLSGSSTGATSLIGRNRITTLGDFAAADLTLDDTAALTVTGSVAGGSLASLDDTAGLAVGTAGRVIAGAISLAGTSLTLDGLVSDGGSGTTSLTARNGAINGSGAVISGVLSGSSTGATSLTGSNSILTLGNFSAAGFTLDDTAALTVTGSVAGGNLASLDDTAGLTVGTAGRVTAHAVSLAGTSLTLAGFVSDGGTGTTSLTATGGAISEIGTLISGTLSGASAGATSLTGTNAVASLGAFTANGGLTLDDSGNLTIAGPVSAGPAAQITLPGALTFTGPLTAGTVALTANSLSLGGTLTGTSQVTLNIAGTVSAAGGLDTPLLTGSSGGATMLTGSNRIGEIDNYTAGTTLSVADGEALTLAGVINAPTMVFDATPNQITIANGTTLVTGGTARPNGPAGSFAYPTSTTSPGAYFSDFVQQGAVTVTSQTGGPSIVRIDAEDGGNITFDPAGGLYGSSTWLILDLHPGGALGTASGNVFVRWLDLIFPLGTNSGGADLGGTINNIGGQAAAGAADIAPQGNARFRFNTCAIGSVNCIVLPIETLPLANPLQEFSIGSFLNSEDEDDLFLPLVSRRDY